MDNPPGNFPFPPQYPPNMPGPQPMDGQQGNMFARLLDTLNCSNMMIANLSQQMAEMRAEVQSLKADNTRLSNEIRMTRTNPVPPVASTPNCSRDMRNEDAVGNHGFPIHEDGRGCDDAGSVRGGALDENLNEAGNGAVEDTENGSDHRRGAAHGVDKRQPNGEQYLTVTEVESTFHEFSGTEIYSVEKWIADFDEMADSLGLSDLRRFVLAKKKLTGLAKLSLGTVSHVTDWKMLKQFLLEEFQKKENSAIIHETLRARQRNRRENVLEYFLIMRGIGAKANLDMEAIITHTVNGIIDDGPDKTLLYGANTMDEFREKLRIYQALKDAKFHYDGRQHKPPEEYNVITDDEDPDEDGPSPSGPDGGQVGRLSGRKFEQP